MAKSKSIYEGKTVTLATKHQKEQVLAEPLAATLGLQLYVPPQLDTDLLGTFSGEIERVGTPREVAIRKARLGMQATGTTLGLASEGSFGPDPRMPFIPADHELLAFVDDDLGITVVEQHLSSKTNFAQRTVTPQEDLGDFLVKVGFPSHALIVKANADPIHFLEKGIVSLDHLHQSITIAASQSTDGMAYVETDMRAHMNPTRRAVIGEVAYALSQRLKTLCPSCQAPGWGKTDVVRGLPCEWCGLATQLVKWEVYGCPRCAYQEQLPRSDGKTTAAQRDCAWCNP